MKLLLTIKLKDSPQNALLNTQSGFTIVELMIALTVLSTILVMSTVILIQIGALYTKGVNAANVQNATRTVTADVSGALQFGASTVRSNPGVLDSSVIVKAYCIDQTRYSYVENRELGADPGDVSVTPPIPASTTPHVLWRDRMKNPSDPCVPIKIITTNPALDISSEGGYEMAPNKTRLTKFLIAQIAGGSDYSIDVWMAYGDSDLVKTDPATQRSTCKGGSGTQYCSVSELSTIVTRRLR